MFFAWDITIAAGTGEDELKEQILKITKGVITRLDVKFPPGCHGLVKVRLLRSEFQLVPLSRDEWVTGDDETVPSETYYELEETPPELKFIGCSPDTTYPHTVTVRIQVLPKAIASSMPLFTLFTKLLERIGVL